MISDLTLFIFLTLWLGPCFSPPEYAQFHKQLQKQLHDKNVHNIHHVWQLSFLETQFNNLS